MQINGRFDKANSCQAGFLTWDFDLKNLSKSLSITRRLITLKKYMCVVVWKTWAMWAYWLQAMNTKGLTVPTHSGHAHIKNGFLWATA
jgi:hypothetical protein